MRKLIAVSSLALALRSMLATGGPPVADLSYLDAQPIMQAMAEILPAALRNKKPAEQQAAWAGWVVEFNSETRSRILRGDEDTLVNYFLFGSSYTRQPRLTASDFRPVGPSSDSGETLASLAPRTQKIVAGRMDDLIRALSNAKGEERLIFFRSLVVQKGFKPGDSGDTGRLKAYMLDHLARVLKEAAGYEKTLAAAKAKGDASAEFAAGSTLFHDRGLSVDTSLPTDYGIEEALKSMQTKRLLEPDSVARVAIIGPGLDFTDKDDGYDFYAPQMLQPIAVLESLSRLGLAQKDGIEVTTLDVNPRINDHVSRARQKALSGASYPVQLPRKAPVPWKEGYVRYWEKFGDQLGSPGPAALPPPDLTGTAVRSVRIRPDVIARIHPVQLNIVTQHLVLPATQRFDLIIATNVFVYYDFFQQCLAMANVERMLRPGGFLLSNTVLLELPFSKIRSTGYQATAYSDRQGDGDNIVWYRRLPD
jgi:hypothetical protein